MFQYLLAFLLINSYYQSLGNPIHANLLISRSLATLANHCENAFLTNAIKNKISDCAVFFAQPYSKKQIRCLIFYDINKQLCSAVAESKLSLTVENEPDLTSRQMVSNVCAQAKDWVLTDISEYTSYKNYSENVFKLPAICGEICGAEEPMNEANDYCKYYQWGIQLLKSPMSTTANNVNNKAADAPVVPEPDSNPKADIAVPINANQFNPGSGNIKMNVQNQVASAPTNVIEEKSDGLSDVPIPKSTVQDTSKHTSNKPVLSSDKKNEPDENIEQLEQPGIPGVGTHEQANKINVTNDSKAELQSDPVVLSESGKDVSLNLDPKDISLEKAEGKGPSDPEDYADADPNDGDEESDDTGLDIKSGPEAKQDSSLKNKLISSHSSDMSQKEYYPNPMTDTFSDDGDHFFPFFLTAVILVVLLYVLYHNKSKVSKVFFGLILEGRSGGRRRNSRGHAYRRLDTLEQAMSANTAAPPSKIIY